MSIYNKLLTGIGGLAAALLFLLGFTAYQASVALSLKDYSIKTAELLQYWDAVQMNTFALVSAPTGILTLKQRWSASVETFEKELLTVSTDPRLKKLSDEVSSSIDETASIWKLTKGQIDAASGAMDEFIKVTASKNSSLLTEGGDGMLGEMNNLEKAGKIDFADKFLFTKFRNYQKSITMTNASFTTTLSNVKSAVEQDVASRIRSSVIAAVLLCAAVIAGAFFFVHIFASAISKRAKAIELSMRNAAGRDFTQRPRVSGSDEIGKLSKHLSELIDSLGGFFRSVKEAVDNVATLKDELAEGTTRSAAAVNEINQNIESIKVRFETLNSALEQAKVALDGIGATLAAFTDQSKRQTESMSGAGKELSRAVEAVGAVSRELTDRARSADSLKTVVLDGGERVQATNEIIKAIAHEIKGISEVIDLIDQISEQTNILSMNAAIESAHAGAAGKGFAVVAEEIRKLAESTQDNAQRIGAALESITTKADTALNSSETTAKAFESINAEVVGFVGALESIASKAATANSEAVRVAAAISESVVVSERTSADVAGMYDRHRSIQDAMTNIKSISDEALLGITEIDAGSREILGGMVKVDEISSQSKDRMTALQAAMDSFKISDESTGVAVKEPPRAVEEPK